MDVLGWGAALGLEPSLADPRLLEHPLHPPVESARAPLKGLL